ncbi:hypothetical protein KAX17_16480 [Candidatus Bipolaricaulota bacterium]|nr:hypothetical protein [Candidatus Bipolaricaulota bacterium]
MRRTDHPSRPESLGDSNPKVLMVWAFRDVTVSGAREAGADVLTTTGLLDSCGAWGLIVELKCWSPLGRLRQSEGAKSVMKLFTAIITREILAFKPFRKR